MAVSVTAETRRSRQFIITSSFLSRYFVVESIDDHRVVYARNSTFAFGNPNLTLHEGPSSSAPIVAACHMHSFSNTCAIGVRDGARPNAMRWEEMTNMGLFSSAYVLGMTLPGQHGRNVRRSFVWKRTHSVGVDGYSMMPLSSRNFKLVDAVSGQVVAVFSSSWMPKLCGILQINVQLGRDFDLAVFATCLCLLKKADERQRRRRAAGAHTATIGH